MLPNVVFPTPVPAMSSPNAPLLRPPFICSSSCGIPVGTLISIVSVKTLSNRSDAITSPSSISQFKAVICSCKCKMVSSFHPLFWRALRAVFKAFSASTFFSVLTHFSVAVTWPSLNSSPFNCVNIFLCCKSTISSSVLSLRLYSISL